MKYAQLGPRRCSTNHNCRTSFVLKYVDWIAELERLVRRRRIGRAVRDLGQRLYVTEGEATAVVRALHRRGLLSQEGETFRYEPRSDALRREAWRQGLTVPRARKDGG